MAWEDKAKTWKGRSEGETEILYEERREKKMKQEL